MPCYNSSEFIDDVVNSVSRQISNRNIEFIIIDDCSNDNTFDIIQKYESLQIKVFKNSINSGPNFSRNIGIKNATGKYILFLDSDDYFSDDAIDLLENIAIKENFDILSFGFNFVSNDKRLLSNHVFINEELHDKFIIKNFLSGKIYAVCWNKMYNRLFLIKNKIFFIEDKIHGRDSIFTLDCCFHANKIISIAEKLYFSNVRNGSFSRNFSLKNVSSLINNLNLLNQKKRIYLLDDDLVDLYISKHVRYILLYSSFNLSFLDYCKALISLINSQNLSRLFKISVMKNYKFSEMILSSLIILPILVCPISRTLKLFKYKPY